MDGSRIHAGDLIVADDAHWHVTQTGKKGRLVQIHAALLAGSHARRTFTARQVQRHYRLVQSR